MKVSITEMKFGLTDTHDCSYLTGRTARSLFLDPAANPSEEVAMLLTRSGFRRTGNHLFKPFCAGCKACVPVRLNVGDFKPRRRHRRIWGRNSDLTIELRQPSFCEDWYRLYERYVLARHPRSEMCPPSRNQFEEFLLSRWSRSLFVCISNQSRVMSIAVTDIVGDAASAVYTFYDPEAPSRSLGIYSILVQAMLTKLCGKRHLYLGYWIDGHAKMHYKLDFSPSELLLPDGRWVACGERTRERSP